MLRNVHFVTLTHTVRNRFSRQSQTAWSTAIATCVALVLSSSTAIGQDTDVADPPATTKPVEQKATPAAGTDETKTQDAPVVLKTLTVDLRDKELSFEAPDSWKAKKPRFNFTKHELMLPKAEGEEKDGRMTFTISSGSTQNNIDRWKAQFKFPLGAAPDKVFSMEKKTVDGYEMSIVQMRGTFMETMGGGPFAGGKKTPRENYMMKAVIISPEGADAKTPKCFIKLIGSEKTIKQHAKAYAAMVESMKTQAVVD